MLIPLYNVKIFRVGMMSLMALGYSQLCAMQNELTIFFSNGPAIFLQAINDADDQDINDSMFLQALVQHLLNNDITLSEIKNAHNQNVLHLACMDGSERAVGVILKIANEDTWKLLTAPAEGHTPLHKAAICGHAKIINQLIEAAEKCPEVRGENGCKAWNFVSMRALWGATVFHEAAEYGQHEVISVLIKALGDNVWELARQRNIAGNTALVPAVDKNHGKFVSEPLLAVGQKAYDLITIKNVYGSIALHSAVMGGNEDIVRTLLTVAAKAGRLDEVLGLTNNLGVRPLDNSCVRNNPRMREIAWEIWQRHFLSNVSMIF